MKRVLTILILLVAVATTYAQLPKATYSTPFREYNAFSKILQLDNGNTVMLQFFLPERIDVRVYDKLRKEVANRRLLEDWEEEGRPSYVLGVHEIAGKPTLFLSGWQDGRFIVRVVLNENTGAIESSELVVDLPEQDIDKKALRGYTPLMKKALKEERMRSRSRGMTVEVAPSGDKYFIMYYLAGKGYAINCFSAVGSKHKLDNTIYYTGGEGNDVNYDESCFLPNDKLFVSGSKGGSELTISVIDMISGAQQHNKLTLGEGYSNASSIIKYNPYTDMVQMLVSQKREEDASSAISLVGKSKTLTYLSVNMKYIDYRSLQPIRNSLITYEPVSTYMATHFDLKEKENFFAAPQDFIVNSDKTTTVLSEQRSTKTVVNNNRVFYYTYLGTIGITKLNEEGKEIDGFAVYKEHKVNQLYSDRYMMLNKKGVQATALGAGWGASNQFFSFDYINTGKNEVVIFNDFLENYQVPERKVNEVDNATICSGMWCKYQQGKVVKGYFYEVPDKRINTFGYTGIYDYEPKTNVYATMVVERDGRKKEVRVVWVRLD